MHRKLRNGKKYHTLASNRRTETDSSGTNIPLNAHESNRDSESEVRMLTQEEADEQIKTYVASLAKQLEDLTRLMQEMSSVHRQNLSSRASTSANSSILAQLSPSPTW